MKRSVLFFSRGRGHGHAIPDMAIADELHRIFPESEIRFVSYATGAETFRRAGFSVIDLQLPEANPYLQTQLLAIALIERLQPDVVVAHEEFAALPAAHLCQRPAIFLGAWLPLADNIMSESLAYADAVIVLEDPGIFPRPSWMQVRPEFVGPIRRKMKYTAANRDQARGELSIPEQCTVVTVVSGGYATENRAPIADTVAGAFARLPGNRKLFWLAGADRDLLRSNFASQPDAIILNYHSCIEQILCASDVVITKGTRGVSLDAAALRVPTISLSHGLNPIDDLLVPRMRSNIALIAPAVDGEILAKYIEQIIATPEVYRFPREHGPEVGVCRAAAALAAAIARSIVPVPAST